MIFLIGFIMECFILLKINAPFLSHQMSSVVQLLSIDSVKQVKQQLKMLFMMRNTPTIINYGITNNRTLYIGQIWLIIQKTPHGSITLIYRWDVYKMLYEHLKTKYHAFRCCNNFMLVWRFLPDKLNIIIIIMKSLLAYRVSQKYEYTLF